MLYDFVIDIDDTMFTGGTDYRNKLDSVLNEPLYNALQWADCQLHTARGMKRSGGLFPQSVQNDVLWEVDTLLRIHNVYMPFTIGKPYAKLGYIDDKAIPASLGHLCVSPEATTALLKLMQSQDFVQYVTDQLQCKN